MSGCVLGFDASLDLDDIWEYIAAAIPPGPTRPLNQHAI
jgi:hypothetical protein